ncbi:DJ-1/PfpI family protein [Streptacidiphilus fuscans]|uniref:DJ-1/PfpI family protein n=1 Tax=Streptacidiphilus fuscans TaxID=2789292 RepID=A0A931FD31_9ACTN|nr:DJ-1/PfpI family protein [Streptacidiphilus fuscans]MBF9067760.1 DJ-1/PfpI family protein [Streptacidiphilus fuscans]
MKIAILLFDRFTSLDAVGPYEILARVPGAEVVFVAAERGEVRADRGSLALVADATLDEVDSADLLLVPGGPGSREALSDPVLLDWIRRVDATTEWTTSVCTGSLLLASAGLLKDRAATSHWNALELLGSLGALPTSERVVLDGKYATAAGVSSGIDLALTLVGRIAGERVAQQIQLLTEYDPEPPYDAGSVAKAPAEIVELLRANNLAITG